jgi:hypothetical protein
MAVMLIWHRLQSFSYIITWILGVIPYDISLTIY